MKKIETVIKFLSHLLAWLSAICISLMMIHVFADVILKYALKRPIVGTAEVVAYYYMLAAVFLPLPLVELRNAGVCVTLFYDRMSTSVRHIIVLFSYVGQFLFYSILAYQSGLDALDSLGKLEVVEGQITLYIWPATFFLPLGLGVAAILSAFRFVQLVYRPDWEKLVE